MAMGGIVDPFRHLGDVTHITCVKVGYPVGITLANHAVCVILWRWRN